MNNIVPFRQREIEDYIQRPLAPIRDAGTVYLVGAGPGDPELLTVKAVKAIKSSDVIVYDRLVDPRILALAPPAAERIYVGKRKDRHSLPQDRIAALLVSLALEGKTVIRLKGGDPFVFGRGGEEIDELDAKDIPWEVIPGITAATGCAASTGIPLTHRDCAHALTFITAHRRDGELKFNWDLATQKDQTVVFYMGLSVVADIAQGLIARGCKPSSPIAIVANGCREDQQVLVGTLVSIGADLEQADLPSPALIILGDVVLRRGGVSSVLQQAGV
ncbi:MAG: uroporphyrinogen-III C-methyltransferase [bacterium]